MAFGTGTHASTRLVLEELQALADAGATPARDPRRRLRLGDPRDRRGQALAAARPASRSTTIRSRSTATLENAAVNRVADRIAARDRRRSPSSPSTFPLVLANIQAHVLRELRAALIARDRAAR